MSSQQYIHKISIKAPARLHLGFLDMHGGLGRRFGSLGLCLSNFFTHITAQKSPDIKVRNTPSKRVEKNILQILNSLGIKEGVDITVHEQIPEHAGLGSGTQLALAIGIAVAKLYGYQKTIQEIAVLMRRGERSGIGIAAFLHGGFLIDGGHGELTKIPPLIHHCYFPEGWQILLVFDHQVEGINGELEKQIFNTLKPMSDDISARICRLVLMQILPAIAEKNCMAFGTGITEIQAMIGEYFSIVQQGYYSSRRVAEIVHWLSSHGATGIGQSSWGPTGFAIYSNEIEAYQVLQVAREHWQQEKDMGFYLCKAHNKAAEIIINDTLSEDLICENNQQTLNLRKSF